MCFLQSVKVKKVLQQILQRRTCELPLQPRHCAPIKAFLHFDKTSADALVSCGGRAARWPFSNEGVAAFIISWGTGRILWDLSSDRSYHWHFGSYAVVWKVTGSSSEGNPSLPWKRRSAIPSRTWKNPSQTVLLGSLRSAHSRPITSCMGLTREWESAGSLSWVLHMSTRGRGRPARRPSLRTQQIRGLLQPAVTGCVWEIIIIVLIGTKVTSSALVKKI